MKSLIVYDENNSSIKTSKNEFESLFERFVNFLDVAPLTVKSYKSGLKRFGEYMRANSISTPKAEDIINFKKALTEVGRKPSTIALYLAAVRRFFSWCEAENLYPNIAAGVKSPKQTKGHKRDYFSSQQIKSILQNINRENLEGMRNYAIFSLMACGGLRTVEIMRARIEDLRTVAGVSVLYVQGKGRTEKTEFVKLPEQVEQAIRKYLALRGAVDESEALFASLSKRNRGQTLTTRSIRRLCKSAMKTAGFDSSRLTAHSLRHTAVTLALLNGQSLQDVQAFARHQNINTTLIYSHAVNRIKSDIENSIANSIF